MVWNCVGSSSFSLEYHGKTKYRKKIGNLQKHVMTMVRTLEIENYPTMKLEKKRKRKRKRKPSLVVVNNFRHLICIIFFRART